MKLKKKKITSVKIHSGNYSDTFWDYEEAYNKNIKNFETKTCISISFGIYWGEAYHFYLDYESDLLIKMDDDILFMDLSRFEEYIDFIYNNSRINFFFPNMINHGI